MQTECALTQSLKRMFPKPMTGAEIEASLVDWRRKPTPEERLSYCEEAIAFQIKRWRIEMDWVRAYPKHSGFRAKCLAKAAKHRLTIARCKAEAAQIRRAQSWFNAFADMVSGPKAPEGFQ